MSDTVELETNTLIVGHCGGWAHDDQHRHYSVTEAEVCAEELDYDAWYARDGMLSNCRHGDDSWYRDHDLE